MNGFVQEARACQAGIIANHDIGTFKHNVTDEMVETFVAVGSMAEVEEKLEPLWARVNHLCPTPPLWNLPPEVVNAYADKIAQFIARNG